MTRTINCYDVEKMYTRIKCFAEGAKMTETIMALAFARRKHKGQTRKSGEPYIIHPLTMACDAIAMGITDDCTIAMILLHDVVEDCNVSIAELPVCDRVKQGVKFLTFTIQTGETKETAKIRYYNAVAEDVAIALAKAVDRCHNVSSMAGTFKKEKLLAYIEETRTFVLPMLKVAKENFPLQSNFFFILEYHITSVIDSIEATLQTYVDVAEVSEVNA